MDVRFRITRETASCSWIRSVVSRFPHKIGAQVLKVKDENPLASHILSFIEMGGGQNDRMDVGQ